MTRERPALVHMIIDKRNQMMATAMNEFKRIDRKYNDLTCGSADPDDFAVALSLMTAGTRQMSEATCNCA